MKKYTCTCSTQSSEQCRLHKKSRFRNLWKREESKKLKDKKRDG